MFVPAGLFSLVWCLRVRPESTLVKHLLKGRFQALPTTIRLGLSSTGPNILSLLWTSVNYGRKKLYNIGHWSHPNRASFRLKFYTKYIRLGWNTLPGTNTLVFLLKKVKLNFMGFEHFYFDECLTNIPEQSQNTIFKRVGMS